MKRAIALAVLLSPLAAEAQTLRHQVDVTVRQEPRVNWDMSDRRPAGKSGMEALGDAIEAANTRRAAREAHERDMAVRREALEIERQRLQLERQKFAASQAKPSAPTTPPTTATLSGLWFVAAQVDGGEFVSWDQESVRRLGDTVLVRWSISRSRMPTAADGAQAALVDCAGRTLETWPDGKRMAIAPGSGLELMRAKLCPSAATAQK